MLNSFQLGNIKFNRMSRVRNLLNGLEIDKLAEQFIELFGKVSIGTYEGNKYFRSENGIIFCYYSAALSILQKFGIRSEIVLVNNLWRIKSNGKWYLLSQYFEFLEENVLTKAKKLLRPLKKLYLRWPIDEKKEYMVITNGKYALMVPPSKVNILREMRL